MLLRKIKYISVLMFFAFQISFAQSFVDAYRLINPGILQTSASLGMGNATMAIGVGYGNYLSNPATLGLMDRSSLTLSYYYSGNRTTSDYFGNSIQKDQFSSNINELGYVYRVPTVRGSLVFGLGYNRVKDFNAISQFSGFNSGNNSLIQDLTSRNSQLTYDLRLSYAVYDNYWNYLYDETLINGKLQQEGTLREEGTINNWSFFSAVEVDKDLYLGITLNLYSGNYVNNRDYYEIDSENYYGDNIQLDPDDPYTIDFQQFYVNDNISWDISGWNIIGGFFYNFYNFLRFAGTIETPIIYKINEKYYVRGSSYFKYDYGYDVEPQTSESEYNISTPVKAGFGMSVNLGLLEASAQAHIADYTQTRFTKGFTDAELNDLNNEIKDNFKVAPDFQAGVVVNIPFLDIHPRVGAMYFVSPYKNATKENNRKYITAGIGFFTHKSFSLDVSAVYGLWNDYYDIYGSGEARVNKEIKDYRAMITMSYKF